MQAFVLHHSNSKKDKQLKFGGVIGRIIFYWISTLLYAHISLLEKLGPPLSTFYQTLPTNILI